MIKLGYLYLDSYNQLRHMKIVRKLNSDKSVYHYVSKHFSEWVNETITTSNIESINHYVVYNSNDEQIGMCGSTKYSSNDIIELWYAIESEYRHCGYAEKLLVELTNYFIEHEKKLRNIRLVINQTNTYSNKVADKSGYSLVDSYKDKNVYTYFKI